MPEYDQDGNVIGGEWNPSPDNEHRGLTSVKAACLFGLTMISIRLMVVMVPHIGDNPPSSEVPGSFWFNTTTQVLYILTATLGQSLVQQRASTATLMADPTTGQFRANRPFLPDSTGLETQQDYNVWVHNSLEDLETQIEAQAGEFKVFMSDTPPVQPEEGDLWYNTVKLQMLVRYDGAWVASAIPLVLDDSFVALSNTVEANREYAAQAVANAITLIEQVANRPERVFGLGYDINEDGIQLTDSMRAILLSSVVLMVLILM